MNDMKKIKSKNVQNYVMNDMVFKVDIPRLLKEIAECFKKHSLSCDFYDFDTCTWDTR